MVQTLLFFAQGVLESTGVLACSLALVRVKSRWKITITAAVVITVIIHIIRNLPVTFGLHTVAAVLMFVTFISKATRVPPSASFIAVFTVMAILLLIEICITKLFLIILSTEIIKVSPANYLWQLRGLPQGTLLLAGGVLISKCKRPLEGMWRI